MAGPASWVKPAERPPVGVSSVGVFLAASVVAALLVEAIREAHQPRRISRGTISVSGSPVGVEPFDVNFTQDGSHVTVTPKSI